MLCDFVHYSSNVQIARTGKISYAVDAGVSRNNGPNSEAQAGGCQQFLITVGVRVDFSIVDEKVAVSSAPFLVSIFVHKCEILMGISPDMRDHIYCTGIWLKPDGGTSIALLVLVGFMCLC